MEGITGNVEWKPRNILDAGWISESYLSLVRHEKVADDSNLMTRDDMNNIGLGDLGDDSHTTLRPDPSITNLDVKSTNTNTTSSPTTTQTQTQERI